jgi:hypothetical protein
MSRLFTIPAAIIAFGFTIFFLWPEIGKIRAIITKISIVVFVIVAISGLLWYAAIITPQEEIPLPNPRPISAPRRILSGENTGPYALLTPEALKFQAKDLGDKLCNLEQKYWNLQIQAQSEIPRPKTKDEVPEYVRERNRRSDLLDSQLDQEFKTTLLLPARNLFDELIRRGASLGNKHPGELRTPEEVMARDVLRLGLRAGSNPLCNTGVYLERLADTLPLGQ